LASDSLPILLEDILDKTADANTILVFLQEFLDFIRDEYPAIYISPGDTEANRQYQALAAHLTRMHSLTQNPSYLDRYLAILHGIQDTMVPEHSEAIAVQERYQNLLDLTQLQQIYQKGSTEAFHQACMQYFHDAIAEMKKELETSAVSPGQAGFD
jgi:hypothetical protein